MEGRIYHYKVRGLGWLPFNLSEEHGKKWDLFCQKLSLLRPNDPNPYFCDFQDFLTELDNESQG